MMNWLLPFLESLDVIPHPSQRVLQRKLALLFADEATGMPNDQIPI
jgi:hypothetical protein